MTGTRQDKKKENIISSAFIGDFPRRELPERMARRPNVFLCLSIAFNAPQSNVIDAECSSRDPAALGSPLAVAVSRRFSGTMKSDKAPCWAASCHPARPISSRAGSPFARRLKGGMSFKLARTDPL